MSHANTQTSFPNHDTSDAGEERTYAVEVACSQDGYLTGWRWARASDGGSPPDGAAVWDVADTSSPVWVADAIPNGSGAGWWEADIVGSIPLLAGHTYRMALGYHNHVSGFAYQNSVSKPAGEFPVALTGTTSWTYYASGFLAYPATDRAASGQNLGIDLRWSSIPLVAPATGGDLDAALTDWLSDNENTHTAHGLPWTTKSVVDGHTATLASIEGSLSDQGATLDAVAGDVADLHAKVTADGVTLDAKIGPLETYGSVGDKGVSAGVEIVRQQVATANTKLDALTGTSFATLREQLTLSPDLLDASRWTLVSTTAGEGRGLVEDQADLYILTLTAVGGLPTVDVAGATWVPRWGWGIAPRVHGAYRQRQFHDYTPAAVTADGLYMDGLLVNALPGVEWAVDAYVLDRGA